MRLNCFLIMAVGASVVSLADVSSAQCVQGGPEGAFPGAGAVTGVWDVSLPTNPLSSSLAVVVPAGATVLNSVQLNGLTHTIAWWGNAASRSETAGKATALSRLPAATLERSCSGTINIAQDSSTACAS